MSKTKLDEQTNIYKEFWQGQKITLAFFSDEMSSEKKNIIIFIILTVCSTVVNFVVPYYTQKLIDVAIPKNNIKDIALYSTFIISSILLSFFINFEIIRKAAKISQNIFKALREKFIFKLLSKNPVFFNRFSSGDIMTRFSNDLDNIYNFFYAQLLYSFIFFLFFI